MVINVGIIGCGRIGERHALHISSTEGLKLAAVCDVVEDRAKDLSEKYRCKHFTSHLNMLSQAKEIDLIAVCTPNGLHALHTIEGLRNGKHVLCEKPMAISTQDCGEMIQASEKANKRLFVIKQNRFNPPVMAVKQVLESGELGKLYSIHVNCFWNRNPSYYVNSWKGSLELDGGTLLTQFSHFVDLIYYFAGDVLEVEAFGDNFHHRDLIEFEDSGVVILKFFNGAIGTLSYSVNSYKKNMEGSCTLICEKGTVKIGGQYLNELEYQSIEGAPLSDLPSSGSANDYGDYQGSMSNHDKVYSNVTDVLVRNGEIKTNMFEGLKTIEIISKIYSKLRKK